MRTETCHTTQILYLATTVEPIDTFYVPIHNLNYISTIIGIITNSVIFFIFYLFFSFTA